MSTNTNINRLPEGNIDGFLGDAGLGTRGSAASGAAGFPGGWPFSAPQPTGYPILAPGTFPTQSPQANNMPSIFAITPINGGGGGGNPTSRLTTNGLPSRIAVDPERVLLFLVIDYMKRKGFLASANQLVTDSRIDALDPGTAETVRLVESLSNMHGKNPQPGGQDAGFLRDWWGTFWSMYSARIPVSTSGGTIIKPRSSPLGMPSIGSPTYQQASGQANSAASAVDSQPGRRKKIVLAAMKSLGMANRDPQSLNPDEQRLVSFAIQQQLASQRAAAAAGLAPMPMHYGGGGGGGGGGGLANQSLANFQNQFLPMSGASPTEPNAKRKKAAPSEQQGIPPGMTPQQIIQLRAIQLQQQQLQLQLQQQQMMMLMTGTPTGGMVGGRPIMPGPNPAPVRKSPNLGTSTGTGDSARSSSVASVGKCSAESVNGLGNGGAGASLNGNIREGQAQAAQEMDESALLSFFGTPADWFSSTTADANALALDHFGATPVGNPAASKASTLIKIDAFSDSEGNPVLASPQPIPTTDPNDLLQLSEQIEVPAAEQVSTKSGRYLQNLAELGSHASGAKAVSTCTSHDGLLMASGGHDRRVMVFSLSQREQLFCLEGNHTQQITQVRFAPCGSRRLLATASFDHTVHLWDLGRVGEDGAVARPESPMLILKDVHDEPVWSIDFIPSNEDLGGPLRLGSIDASGKLVLWDLETGIALYTTLIKTKDDWAVTVRQIKARPSLHNAPSMLAIANGSHVELFDCNRMEIVSSLLASAPLGEQKGKSVVSLSWGYTENPGYLIAATSEAVSLWDLSVHLQDLTVPPTILANTQVPADKITCAALLRELPCVVIGGYQALYLWEVVAPGERAERPRPVKFPAHEGLVASVSVTRSGPLLVGTVAHDGSVILWKVDTIPIPNPSEDSSSEVESTAFDENVRLAAVDNQSTRTLEDEAGKMAAESNVAVPDSASYQTAP